MIIEYEEKYIEEVRDLLVELEEYIVSIDKDELDIVGEEYREKYIISLLKEVKETNGKIYLYLEDGKVLGMVAGGFRNYAEDDYLDYKCPKAGRVFELVTTQKERSKGIGRKLLNKIEEYFKDHGCEYISIDVFAYNDNAKRFYENGNYHARMHTYIKQISE